MLYVAGHNVVILDMDQLQQTFIAGSPNSDCISCVAVSAQNKFLAVCEKARPHATLTIYDLENQRKCTSLPELDLEEMTIVCKEFLACAFSPLGESQHIVTLCGEGDWSLVLW